MYKLHETYMYKSKEIIENKVNIILKFMFVVNFYIKNQINFYIKHRKLKYYQYYL